VLVESKVPLLYLLVNDNRKIL